MKLGGGQASSGAPHRSEARDRGRSRACLLGPA